MRLPWVSVARHVAMREDLLRVVAHEQEDARQLRSEVRALSAQLAESKDCVNVLRRHANATRESGGDNLIRAMTAEERADRAERLFDDLLSRYHMLRLQGANEAAPAPVQTERPTPDPVTAAINEASAGKDAKVRKAMLEQVKRDRAAGLKDTDIITRIARGNRVADELEATT